MADRPPPLRHNGVPPLDDPTPDRPGRCRDCRHWTPPPENLERDYEFFRLGLSRRRVKRPTGTCDRVLLGNSEIPAFAGTAGNFSCRNFEAAPPKPAPKGGGFVTIWRGDRILWQGPEDEIPPRFRDGDDASDPLTACHCSPHNHRRARLAAWLPIDMEIVMMTRDALSAALARMEQTLADARHNLALAERAVRDRAEAMTIQQRPKARHYNRRMSRWTGADEAAYLCVLDDLLVAVGPDLDRLRRRIERQEAAIVALRRKYGVNDERPCQRFGR